MFLPAAAGSCGVAVRRLASAASTRAMGVRSIMARYSLEKYPASAQPNTGVGQGTKTVWPHCAGVLPQPLCPPLRPGASARASTSHACGCRGAAWPSRAPLTEPWRILHSNTITHPGPSAFSPTNPPHSQPWNLVGSWRMGHSESGGGGGGSRGLAKAHGVGAAAAIGPLADGEGDAAEEGISVGDHGALHAINIAIAANFAIFVAKLAVYFASGSSAMLAEAVHSVADVCNQALLRTGVMKSLQAPTLMHPYGYSRDRFVWSLISAVGIFCLGAGVSIVHGINSAMSSYQLEYLGWGLAVLGVSFLLEGYSLMVAVRMVMKAAAARGMSFFEFCKRGADPTSVAIVMEDAAAVAGLVIAGACTTAAHLTGKCIYDATGSIAVGSLLGFVAVTLVQRNRELLIGRSLPSDTMEKLMEHLKNDPVVKAVYDAKSEEIGMGVYRFKAEIDFCGETLVTRHLERSGRSVLHDKIRAATWTEDSRALDMVLRQYGKEVVEALASEVDRIEMELREIEPGLKHLDLEADRRPPLSQKALLGLAGGAAKAQSPKGSLLSSASVDYWNFRKDSIVNDEFVAEAELQKGTNLDANRRL